MPAAFDPDRAYRLHEDVSILADLHDNEQVLRGIAESGPDDGLLDDARFDRRCSVLVARREGGAASWNIDPGAAEIVRLFEQPRRCSEVIEWVREVAPGGPDSGWFEALARARVLVAADSDAGEDGGS
jgi:hypothetical protein